MRKETQWGAWDHLPLAEMVAILRGMAVPWWIAGGYAIDAFAGLGRREHDDLDIGVFARDQLAVQKHFGAWELHCADPPGTLRPWLAGERLASDIHDIWVRRDAADDWRFQLMLNPGGPNEFVYRRDERMRMPLERATFVKDGVRYLAAELQLLFKSRNPRPKDEQDLRDCLPLLSAGQRAWLADAMALVAPASPWRWALRGPGQGTSDLLTAAQSTLGFWNNEFDDEDWHETGEPAS